MRSGNRIAIVGAGIAGLVCAKVLTEDGFAVEVFDRAPDIGGVWSETRRYPGLRAQSSKNTYHFSDHPMPADYPRVLDGARMQEYLSSYVRAFGLTDKLRLRTEVVAADPVDGGWLLEIRDADGAHRTSCDHLVIANGVFSEPEVPDFAGAAEFARAGGQIGHSTQFLDVEAVRDRSVVVVGYGAAAGDLATEISRVAADTTVVARRLLWKMPRRLAAGIDAERILLTRTGAAHFRHPEPGRFERLLHGPGRSFRESNLDLIEALVAERSGAAELGLLPGVRFEQAYDAAFGLATADFAEQVTQGRITVHGQMRVAALGGGPAGPFAELSDGRRIRADIVVCATGFQQRVPFLTPYVQRQLTDDNGNFRLYRQILPLDVPHLTFAGYNASLLSAVGAEVGAHWTAALLTGSMALPPVETMTERIENRLRWLDQNTGGRHAHGTVTPYAIRDIDDLLTDLGVRLPRAGRAAQWVRPVRPSDYRVVSRRKRGPAGQAGAPAVPEQVAAHPPTAPLAVGQQAAARGAQPETVRSQPEDVVAPADRPTVRIPEAVVASAVRTTTLPAVDPAARTRPVPEVRPAAPVKPRATPPAPPPAPVPPRSAAAQRAADEAARRAAAEQRAAGIAARSNSPTVRIDMRTAESLADEQTVVSGQADESASPAVPDPLPGQASASAPEVAEPAGAKADAVEQVTESAEGVSPAAVDETVSISVPVDAAGGGESSESAAVGSDIDGQTSAPAAETARQDEQATESPAQSADPASAGAIAPAPAESVDTAGGDGTSAAEADEPTADAPGSPETGTGSAAQATESAAESSAEGAEPTERNAESNGQSPSGPAPRT
ncbi:FAD-dependent oxidoreductase [Nocardia sp. NPDC019395]|uniref:FAD-dependent oxidoreductase n=1 Tax=Nocardia sp. NPDC019395 TaxID=3154686 RepID=UPI0033D5BD56